MIAIKRSGGKKHQIGDINIRYIKQDHSLWVFFNRSCVFTIYQGSQGHLHARDQDHFEDVLCAGRGVPHGHIEGPVDAKGYLSQVALLLLLPVAIVGHADVWVNTMEV